MRAKRSNPLSLAVLVLLYERPMHPYEMASTLRERQKEQSIRLNYGSLYTVIELLLRSGLIRIKQTVREGRRPQKTIYELTSAGKLEMTEWLREIIAIPVKEYPQFEAGLSLIPALPPEEALPLLRNRLGVLAQRLKALEESSLECRKMNLPRLFSLESEYHEALTRAEHQFVGRLVRDLEKNTGDLRQSWTNLRKNLARKIASKSSKKSRVRKGETT